MPDKVESVVQVLGPNEDVGIEEIRHLRADSQLLRECPKHCRILDA